MINYLNSLKFASPWILFFLILPLLFIAWQIWRYQALYPTLRLPILKGVSQHSRPIRGFIKKYLFVLRVLGMASLIVALARPQRFFQEQEINTEGIDIVLALDVSESMLAQDFKPNRLGAAKNKALKFIENRTNDRIGLVVFAGESFTQCPLTIDHKVVKKLLMEIQSGWIEGGTAIGMGLGTAVNRLKESDAKSKVIILLTDGVNNRGNIAPENAAEMATSNNIRVYAIGVGTQGQAPMPYDTPFGKTVRYVDVEIDEELLKDIAAQTGGKYFRATNNRSLEEVYNKIEELEKSKIEVSVMTRETEEFYIFLWIGIALFGLEMILRYALVRSIP